MDETTNKKITLGNCIKMFFKNYVNFKGTATRKEFWMTMSIIGGVFLLLFVLFVIITNKNNNVGSVIFVVCFLLYLLATIIPFFSLYIRRIRDTGKSLILGVIPFAAFLLGRILPEFISPFTPDYETKYIAMCIIFYVIGIIAFAILCSIPSGSCKKNIETEHVNVSDELLKLNDLLNQGILTQEEFDEQKKKILMGII